MCQPITRRRRGGRRVRARRLRAIARRLEALARPRLPEQRTSRLRTPIEGEQLPRPHDPYAPRVDLNLHPHSYSPIRETPTEPSHPSPVVPDEPQVPPGFAYTQGYYPEYSPEVPQPGPSQTPEFHCAQEPQTVPPSSYSFEELERVYGPIHTHLFTFDPPPSSVVIEEIPVSCPTSPPVIPRTPSTSPPPLPSEQAADPRSSWFIPPEDPPFIADLGMSLEDYQSLPTPRPLTPDSEIEVIDISDSE